MVADIFEVITSSLTSFASAITSAVTSITSLFYTPGVDGASGSMTFLGVLLLIGAGVGIVYFVIRWISSLVRRTA